MGRGADRGVMGFLKAPLFLGGKELTALTSTPKTTTTKQYHLWKRSGEIPLPCRASALLLCFNTVDHMQCV